MPVERKCARCDAAFTCTPSAARRGRRYCGIACRGRAAADAYRARWRERRCEACGADYRVKPSQAARSRYCSIRCANPARARETAEARGDKLRGRGSGRSYVKRGGRHEHRVVAEEVLGRPLAPGEVVHHLDEDKHNNAPDNLQVLPSRSAHWRVHHDERALAWEEAERGRAVGED